jgi:hypothetical protein
MLTKQLINNHSTDTTKLVQFVDFNLLIYFFQIKLGLYLEEPYASEVFQFSAEILKNISKSCDQTTENQVFNKKLLHSCRILENAVDINFTYLKHLSHEVFEILES